MQFGTELNVRIARADVEKRQIDLALVKEQKEADATTQGSVTTDPGTSAQAGKRSGKRPKAQGTRTQEPKARGTRTKGAKAQDTTSKGAKAQGARRKGQDASRQVQAPKAEGAKESGGSVPKKRSGGRSKRRSRES